MALKADLEEAVAKIFRERWETRDGYVVPAVNDLKLGNDGVNLDAVVLYADMSDSTKLVDEHGATFAAEVYKAYLECAARIVKAEGGVITAYDGDRLMAVFIGDSKNSSAAKAALKINHAVQMIINPALRAVYTTTGYLLTHVVGIDSSSIMVARIGVRNDNDLVWVGRAANHAAKMCAIKEKNTTFVSKAVYDMLNEGSKYGGNPSQDMWEARSWPAMGNITIYRSTWLWGI